MKLAILYVSFFASSALPLFAQVDTISLQDALDLAQKNNATIKIAEIGIKQDESRFHEVSAARYPALAFRSHYLYTPEPGYNEAVTNGGEYGVQLSTGVPLFDGGVRGALTDQSSNAVATSRVGLQKSSSEIAFAVRIQYYETLRAEEELDIRRETAGRLQDYLTFVNQLRLGGTATERSEEHTSELQSQR